MRTEFLRHTGVQVVAEWDPWKAGFCLHPFSVLLSSPRWRAAGPQPSPRVGKGWDPSKAQ